MFIDKVLVVPQRTAEQYAAPGLFHGWIYRYIITRRHV